MATGQSDLIDISGDLRHETTMAYLFHDGTREVWLPKSMVEIETIGSVATATMPEWLALEKGLI